jgi:hypothetical protein
MIELDPPQVDLKQQKFNGFACPQVGLDVNFMESLAVMAARKAVRSFLVRYGTVIEQHSVGLLGIAQEWLRQESSFEMVWDLTLGNILTGIRKLSHDPAIVMRRSAELALRINEFGLTGRWEANLVSSARLRFGAFWLPLADRLAVEATHNHLKLNLYCGSSVESFEFNRTAEGWQTGVHRPETLFHVKTGSSIIRLLPSPVLQPEERDEYGMDTSEATAVMRDNLQTALDLIRDYSPIYLPWVERVIRGIIPGKTGENVFISGSDMGKPGIVHASINIRPVMLAELLVHEGTHQYMLLLSRLGNLDNGGDPTLYYSPVKKTGRPISAIALSYHAFANIILFYRLCQANGLADDGYCVRNEKAMREQVAVLEEPLRTTQALTPQGRALWEPLAGRLREV